MTFDLHFKICNIAHNFLTTIHMGFILGMCVLCKEICWYHNICTCDFHREVGKQRWWSCEILRLLRKGRGPNPVFATSVLEIVYLLLPSRDMTERLLKRRKMFKIIQPWTVKCVLENAANIVHNVFTVSDRAFVEVSSRDQVKELSSFWWSLCHTVDIKSV